MFVLLVVVCQQAGSRQMGGGTDPRDIGIDSHRTSNSWTSNKPFNFRLRLHESLANWFGLVWFGLLGYVWFASLGFPFH